MALGPVLRAGKPSVARLLASITPGRYHSRPFLTCLSGQSVVPNVDGESE